MPPVPELNKDVISKLTLSPDDGLPCNNFDQIVDIALSSTDGFKAFTDLLEHQQPFAAGIYGWPKLFFIVELKDGFIHTNTAHQTLCTLALPYIQELAIETYDPEFHQHLVESIALAKNLRKVVVWCDLPVEAWQSLLKNCTARNVYAFHPKAATAACKKASIVLEHFEFIYDVQDLTAKKLKSIFGVPCKSLQLAAGSHIAYSDLMEELLYEIRKDVASSSVQKLEFTLYVQNCNGLQRTLETLQKMFPNLKMAKIVVRSAFYHVYPNLVQQVYHQIKAAEIQFELDFVHQLKFYKGIPPTFADDLNSYVFKLTKQDVYCNSWIYGKRQVADSKKLTMELNIGAAEEDG